MIGIIYRTFHVLPPHLKSLCGEMSTESNCKEDREWPSFEIPLFFARENFRLRRVLLKVVPQCHE